MPFNRCPEFINTPIFFPKSCPTALRIAFEVSPPPSWGIFRATTKIIALGISCREVSVRRSVFFSSAALSRFRENELGGVRTACLTVFARGRVILLLLLRGHRDGPGVV